MGFTSTFRTVPPQIRTLTRLKCKCRIRNETGIYRTDAGVCPGGETRGVVALKTKSRTKWRVFSDFRHTGLLSEEMLYAS